MFARLLRALPAARTFSSSARRDLVAKVTIVGRVAADPEVATGRAGDYVKYSVGSSQRRREGDEQTSWFRITAFDEGSRKLLTNYVKKGSLVYVEGDITLQSYESEDGRKHNYTNIVQRVIRILSRPIERNQESESESE